MKKKGAIIVLTALGLIALLGSGPCDEAQLDDNIDALSQYFGRMVHPGSVVDVFDKMAYYVGQDLNPNTIDFTTVVVNRIDDPVGPVTTNITGLTDGFDFSYCGSTGYIIIIEIFTWTDFDLSSTVGWLNLRLSDGRDVRITVPAGAPAIIEAGQTLVLYVAADGSTYFALNDTIFPDANPRTHDMSWGYCDWVGSGCPSLTPAQAYTPANLAGAAGGSPSTAPLLLVGNSIEPTAGLNGGLLAEITNDVLVFAIAIDSCPPYFGYDQPNNTFYFLLGGYSLAGGYSPGSHWYLDPNPYPLAYPNGVVFSPNNGAACDLNPNANYELVLQWIQLKDGAYLPNITIPFSTGPAPPGYTLNLCVP